MPGGKNNPGFTHKTVLLELIWITGERHLEILTAQHPTAAPENPNPHAPWGLGSQRAGPERKKRSQDDLIQVDKLLPGVGGMLRPNELFTPAESLGKNDIRLEVDASPIPLGNQDHT